MASFSLIVVNADFYAYKLDIDRGGIYVPVIRIFGSNLHGLSTCCHVHGVFPYLYFRPEHTLDTMFESEEVTRELFPQLLEAIESSYHIIASSANTSTPKSIIHKLEVVSKVSMYGYHAGSQIFVKLTYYNPLDVTRITSVLESGVLGKRMQVYEGHVPYLLQFFMDYNIHGMNWLHLRHVTYRTSIPAADTRKQSTEAMYTPPDAFYCSFISPMKQSPAATISRSSTAVPADASIDVDTLLPISTCEVEIDCSCRDILNWELRTKHKDLQHMPSLAELWIEEAKRSGDMLSNRNSCGKNNGLCVVSGEDMFGNRMDSLRAKGAAMFDAAPLMMQLSQEQICSAENWIEGRKLLRGSQIESNKIDKTDVYRLVSVTGSCDGDAELPDDESSDDIDEIDELETQAQEIVDIMCSNSDYIASQENNERDIAHTLQQTPEKYVSTPTNTDVAGTLHSSKSCTPNFHIAHALADTPTRLRSLQAKRQRVQFADTVNQLDVDIEDITSPTVSSELCLTQISPVRFSGSSRTSTPRRITLVPSFTPPTRYALDVTPLYATLSAHTPAHYSVLRDVPTVPLVVAAQRKVVKYNRDVPLFEPFSGSKDDLLRTIVSLTDRKRYLIGVTLQPTFKPPPRDIIETENSTYFKQQRLQSQFETPTQSHSLQSHDHDMQCTSTTSGSCRVTVLSVEVLAMSRGDVLPNPKIATDGILSIVWNWSEVSLSSEVEVQQRAYGVLAFSLPEHGPEETLIKCIRSSGLPACDITVHTDERDLLLAFVNIVAARDPDLLVGYEVQNSSWGYLIERGMNLTPPLHLLQLLSRVPTEKPSNRNEYDKYGEEHESGIWITGRIVLNIWRRMKAELKLTSFTQSYLASFLLHRRFAEFSAAQLTRWYKKTNLLSRCIRYLFRCSELNFQLMERIDLIRRTAESARLYGIDLFSVLTRGSQYRVEAALLRVAHSKGYVAISPNKHKVAAQAAMEIIPLVMEPRSNFYVDPVLVLDFQSLYPSMVLAYNLCFTTICGKLRAGNVTGAADTSEKLGAISYPEELAAHACANEHKPYIAPNGSMFCHKVVREGVLPMMLREILATRVMVKQAMKRHSGDKHAVLRRVLDARQLALKLLANVTYGYTAAGFSGRMPMAELADAIVACGRSTLEWTIGIINRHPNWHAEVVYGDTDSVFVHVKGRTLQQAFALGREIASTITNQCPDDVVLKFEKVYLPCLLVSKKRYVGQSYEVIEESHLDAKGIEMVRRDQCPVTVKLQEKCLRILFSTKDLSLVKKYLYGQWMKMHEGGDKLPIKDYIFSKEVRLGHYNNEANMPAGAVVATKSISRDPRTRPPYRWRVPYVVIAGSPAARLKELVISPHEYMQRREALRINYIYYITKCLLPSLDRVLSLAGADVKTWYKYMPKPAARLRRPMQYNAARGGRVVQHIITEFMKSRHCIVCGELCAKFACDECMAREGDLMAVVIGRINAATHADRDLAIVCNNCSQHAQPSQLYECNSAIGEDACLSLECNVMFERHRFTLRREDLHSVLQELLDKRYFK